jgi:hypothetical protein
LFVLDLTVGWIITADRGLQGSRHDDFMTIKILKLNIITFGQLIPNSQGTSDAFVGLRLKWGTISIQEHCCMF